jgi:hypothetical protein
MRKPHTSCHRGKRIVIVLKRSRERIKGRFETSNDNTIFLEDGRKISIEDVKAFWVDRLQDNRSK